MEIVGGFSALASQHTRHPTAISKVGTKTVFCFVLDFGFGSALSQQSIISTLCCPVTFRLKISPCATFRLRTQWHDMQQRPPSFLKRTYFTWETLRHIHGPANETVTILMEHSAHQCSLENKSAELSRHYHFHYHTSCRWLPERGDKAMLVKTVCLRKPALGGRRRISYGTGGTLLKVSGRARDLTTWTLVLFVTGIYRTRFK